MDEAGWLHAKKLHEKGHANWHRDSMKKSAKGRFFENQGICEFKKDKGKSDVEKKDHICDKSVGDDLKAPNFHEVFNE